MAAGADFIKTSTGKIPAAATPEATYVMCQAIKEWNEKNNGKFHINPPEEFQRPKKRSIIRWLRKFWRRMAEQ